MRCFERFFALADSFTAHLIEESCNPSIVLALVRATSTATLYEENFAAIFAACSIYERVAVKADWFVMEVDHKPVLATFWTRKGALKFFRTVFFLFVPIGPLL